MRWATPEEEEEEEEGRGVGRSRGRSSAGAVRGARLKPLLLLLSAILSVWAEQHTL